MNSRTKLTLVVAVAWLSGLFALGMLDGPGRARAESAPQAQSFAAIVAPSPDYTVNPADTDGQVGTSDCPLPGIGCFNDWGDFATNFPHIFYLPPSNKKGKLLVYFNGGDGFPNPEQPTYSFAASLGYHVIGLSYRGTGDSAKINGCDADSEQLTCYEDFMREELFGTDDCEHETCTGLNVNFHPQDAALNRLKQALKWARDNKDDGWGEYLTQADEINWNKVNVAGFSNGSSFASLMGTLFPSVGRVTVFSGPNDGDGNSSASWTPASYIHFVAGTTDTHYYGLVHELNKAPENGDTSKLYKVTNNWREFGMGEPYNASAVRFDPVPGETPNFGSAHMLISTNPTTDYFEAHNSVVYGRECSDYGFNGKGEWGCLEYEGDWIGYDPAWRCVLGVGDPALNTGPTANAGEDQSLECAGDGGAMVKLDGSLSGDPECDLLSYTWNGPFGTLTGRKTEVFLPVGTHVITLVVSDGAPSSTSSDTMSVTVTDTQPPTLTLVLSQTELWPANHRLIRVEATVSATDGCGGPPPQILLTSITSNQPDDGTGDGDTPLDIQDADLGTFDLSFLLRAERSGHNPEGRTYTVTYTAIDASGNCTQASATVRVPYSKS